MTGAAYDPRRFYKRTYIRERRLELNLSQDELAKRVGEILQRVRGERRGYSKPQVSKLEDGKRGYTQEVLEAMAEALDCAPAQLLTGEFSSDNRDAALLEAFRSMLTQRDRRQVTPALPTVRRRTRRK